MAKIPVKLRQDTIVEAIFEMRFTSHKKPIADLLPGLLFSKIQKDFPSIERLPVTSLPSEIIQADPNLRYAPQHRLVGGKYSLLIGEHVFAISCPKPYSGWKEFCPTILKLSELLGNTGLISEVERFSLRYVNIIPTGANSDLSSKLKSELRLGSHNLNDKSTQIRTEVLENNLLNVIKVVAGTTIELITGEKIQGCLFDVDTICQQKFENFWKDLPSLVERAHATEKQIFFGILRDETINELGPIWN